MSSFALDKNYDQIVFEQISVAELEVVSGGSGGISQCLQGIATGAGIGAAGGAASGALAGGIGAIPGALAGGFLGGMLGAAGSCFG
jgi:hypothetical protein